MAGSSVARAEQTRASRALPDWVAAAVTFLASGSVLVLEVVGLRLIAPYVGITLQTSTAPEDRKVTPAAIQFGSAREPAGGGPAGGGPAVVVLPTVRREPAGRPAR